LCHDAEVELAGELVRFEHLEYGDLEDSHSRLQLALVQLLNLADAVHGAGSARGEAGVLSGVVCRVLMTLLSIK